MRRLAVIVSILAMFLLSACPSKPSNTRYSDPETAQKRSDKAMEEMSRETR
ncbi:MAG: hypothetical protein OEZ43_09925 [Gammaproteobacteria bacterium]|nr:hypothetical protein [Gammaproteobacteria bacterium]